MMSRGYVIPVNPVSGEAMSPYETRTGTPLPILQTRVTCRKNRHHAFFFEHAYLNGSKGERASRFARIQVTDRVAHMRFHQFFKGTQKPADNREAFIQTLLGYAGYVPEFAVDVSGSEPRVVHLNEKRRNIYRQPKVFQIEKEGRRQAEIGRFIMGYALEQNFYSDCESDIEQFLSIRGKHVRKDPDLRATRELLAFKLMDRALEVAVEPLADDFDPVCAKVIRIGAPAGALALAQSYVAGHRQDYVDSLYVNLKTQVAA